MDPMHAAPEHTQKAAAAAEKATGRTSPAGLHLRPAQLCKAVLEACGGPEGQAQGGSRKCAHVVWMSLLCG